MNLEIPLKQPRESRRYHEFGTYLYKWQTIFKNIKKQQRHNVPARMKNSALLKSNRWSLSKLALSDVLEWETKGISNDRWNWLLHCRGLWQQQRQSCARRRMQRLKHCKKCWCSGSKCWRRGQRRTKRNWWSSKAGANNRPVSTTRCSRKSACSSSACTDTPLYTKARFIGKFFTKRKVL